MNTRLGEHTNQGEYKLRSSRIIPCERRNLGEHINQGE